MAPTPNEYIYLENDILNFRDKSLHKGTPFQKQYEAVKRVTQDFQSIQVPVTRDF
jgi:hypothetical protein